MPKAEVVTFREGNLSNMIYITTMREVNVYEESSRLA